MSNRDAKRANIGAVFLPLAQSLLVPYASRLPAAATLSIASCLEDCFAWYAADLDIGAGRHNLYYILQHIRRHWNLKPISLLWYCWLASTTVATKNVRLWQKFPPAKILGPQVLLLRTTCSSSTTTTAYLTM